MIENEISAVESEVTRLYDDTEANYLTPLWRIEETLMSREPKPKAVPWLWKWSTLYDIAHRSGILVPIERGGDRRAIALSNPGLHGQPFATPTLWAAIQWLNGYEVAPAHLSRPPVHPSCFHDRARARMESAQSHHALERPCRPPPYSKSHCR